jgi:hypothetical protein
MFIVKYDSDPDRKKIEYIASKYETGIFRPDGYMLLVNDDIYDEVKEQITMKFPVENVKSFEVHEEKISPVSVSSNFALRFDKGISEVKSFISYLLSKRRAIMISSDSMGSSYKISTRKGNLKLDVMVHADFALGCTVSVILNGSGEAVDMITKEFSEELKIFGGKDLK